MRFRCGARLRWVRPAHGHRWSGVHTRAQRSRQYDTRKRVCASIAAFWVLFGCGPQQREAEHPGSAEHPSSRQDTRAAEVLNPWILTGLAVRTPESSESDTILLAGSDAAILRSSDGGASFIPAQTPGAETLFDLAASSEDAVRVAVGAAGTILSSSDDGRTWNLVESGSRDELRCVAYDPASDRWIVAGSGGRILVSSDQAQSFRTVPAPTSSLLASFLGGLDGGGLLLGGEDGALLYSDRAGEEWTQVQAVTNEALTALVPADAARVYALGSAGSVLRSSNGGRSFEAWIQPDGRYWTGGVFVAALDALVLIDAHGEVARLYDRDGRLEPVASLPSTYLSTILQADDGTLLVVGDAGHTLHSVDAGETWSFVETGAGALLESAVFAASSHTWISFGRGGLRTRSTDGGDSWRIDAPDLSRYLHAVLRVPDSQIVIGVGSEAALVRSDDLGNRFTPLTLDVAPSTYLYSAAALGSEVVVAAGPSGVVVRSRDAGRTWETVRQGREANDGYYHRIVYDEARGVLVVLAGPGRVLRSIDRAESFEEADARTDLHLFAGSALQPEGVLLAVGQQGSIQRSLDGLHWDTVPSGVTGDLYAVTRPAPGASVFALGARGALLRSTDAGSSWQALAVPTQSALDALLQTPTGALVAAGARGTLLRSEDAGERWTQIAAPTTEDLRALSADVRTGVLLAVGRRGTLLGSWDDGRTWTQLETHSQGNLKSILALPAPGDALLFGERLIRVRIPEAPPSPSATRPTATPRATEHAAGFPPSGAISLHGPGPEEDIAEAGAIE